MKEVYEGRPGVLQQLGDNKVRCSKGAAGAVG